MPCPVSPSALLLLVVVLPVGCVIDWNGVWPADDGGSNTQDVDGSVDAAHDSGGVALPDRFCEDNWCWESPLPQGLSLEDVWAAGADDVFAVGENGAIVRFDGSSWKPMDSGTSEDLKGIWGFSGDDIWAVGGSVVLRFEGEAWKKIASCGDLTSVWGSAADELWLVGLRGEIFRFDGETCSAELSPTDADLNDVWGVDGNTIYAVGSGGTILRYDGDSWRKKLSNVTERLNAIGGPDGDTVYIVGDGGVVLRRTQQGAIWEAIAAPTTADLFGVWGDADGAYLVGSNKAVLRYTASNDRWDDLTLTAGEDRDLMGVWGDGNDDLFVVGADGALARHNTDGWVRYDAGYAGLLTDVWASGSDDIFVVGRNIVLHFDGQRWASIAELSYGDWTGVWGSGPDDVFIVGSEGLNSKSAHFDGAAWRAIDTDGEGLNDVSGVGAEVYAVGWLGRVLSFEAGEWIPEPTPTDQALYGVWVGPGLAYAVGREGTVLRRAAGSWTLSEPFTSQNLHAVWASGTDDVHVVGAGIAARFDGNDWLSSEAGFLKSLWGTSSDNVYAVGSTIELFDGKSWRTVSTMSRAFEGIWGIAPGEMVAVGDNGIVRYSAP